MSKIPNYIPEKDGEIFREWLRKVLKSENLSDQKIVDNAAEWLKIFRKKTPFGDMTKDSSKYIPSSSVVKRIRLGIPAGEKSTDRIRWMWNYLREDEIYSTYYPGKTVREEVFETITPNAQLANALESFFTSGSRSHRYTNEHMQKMLLGQYVLYRQDFEFAARRRKQPKCIRASRVDIWTEGEVTCFSETQDYAAQPKHRRPAHYQKNVGILVPYGDFVIGVMNADKAMSFKCVVINEILSFAETGAVPTEWFSGKMLVASDRGLPPSQLFFCRRSENIDAERNGFYEYDEVDDEVIHYLSTPTFRDDFNPTF